MFFVFVIACAADGEGPESTPPGETGETATGPTDSDPGDSTPTETPTESTPTESTPTEPAPCPVGMSPIPPEDPSYCIHTWEVTFDGTGGDLDQWAAGAVPTESTVSSAGGVIPEVGMSFSQAEIACANTRAVDALGVDHGAMWLATAREWEDAGDGVVGAGGTLRPWGDAWDASRCVTTDDDGNVVWPNTQVTGLLETCRSDFGVYDQIGNVWEWVDSEIPIDVAAWLAAWPELGRDGDVLTAHDDTVGEHLRIEVTGVSGEVEVEDGGVRWRSDPAAWGTRTEINGWAVMGSGDPATTNLPVQVVDDGRRDEDGWIVAEVRILDLADGHSFPDKRGGAWYAGNQPDLVTPSYAHTWEFNGTIGFRCACAPFVD